MPIRIYEIAAKHGGDVGALLAKAKALGFRARGGSTSVDRVTAEALELAAYGNATAVRFDLPHCPGAEGRLVHLRSLISAIKEALAENCLNQRTEESARLLAHLLAVSRSKDWIEPPPPEWEEAQALVGQLTNLGIHIEVEELPRSKVPELRKAKQQQPPPPFSRKVLRGVRKVKRKVNRRSRKKRKKKGKPWLLYTPFETSRRRH